MKSLFLFSFMVVLSFGVLASCTMPYSFLPPEISSGSRIVMDGYDWVITESNRGSNILHRSIVRSVFEYHDSTAYVTDDVALRIARNFFERNSNVLGAPSSVSVAVAGNKLPAVVTFVGSERQYCEGIPVIGTVSGSLYIGEGDELQVSSLEIDWFVDATANLVPNIPSAQILKENPGSNPGLALLPDKDNGDMRLVWELNDSSGRLIDANTGKEVKPPSPYDKYYDWLFFSLSVIAVVAGYFIVTKTKLFKTNKKS